MGSGQIFLDDKTDRENWGRTEINENLGSTPFLKLQKYSETFAYAIETLSGSLISIICGVYDERNSKQTPGIHPPSRRSDFGRKVIDQPTSADSGGFFAWDGTSIE